MSSLAGCGSADQSGSAAGCSTAARTNPTKGGVLMDDLCVHCGEPIDYVPLTPNGTAWLHRLGGRLCADGSGHMACPPQAGIE